MRRPRLPLFDALACVLAVSMLALSLAGCAGSVRLDGEVTPAERAILTGACVPAVIGATAAGEPVVALVGADICARLAAGLGPATLRALAEAYGRDALGAHQSGLAPPS